jgi:3-hydroxybutyryl-CoA dehydratase
MKNPPVGNWVESHVFTKEDLLAYAWVSGDHNPIHYNEAAVQSRGFPKLIVHGMFIYCWVYRLIGERSERPIKSFAAKFSSITSAGEAIKVNCEAKDESRFKLQILGCESGELKCAFSFELA